MPTRANQQHAIHTTTLVDHYIVHPLEHGLPQTSTFSSVGESQHLKTVPPQDYAIFHNVEKYVMCWLVDEADPLEE
jgi:hypothetical protein